MLLSNVMDDESYQHSLFEFVTLRSIQHKLGSSLLKGEVITIIVWHKPLSRRYSVSVLSSKLQIRPH